LQIERYGGAPGRIDRQRERLRVRRDEGLHGIGLFGPRGAGRRPRPSRRP
jgi:hypothetical protein